MNGRLTGRQGVRLLTRLFRKPVLVLQVEIEVGELGEPKTEWIDARIQDITFVKQRETERDE